MIKTYWDSLEYDYIVTYSDLKGINLVEARLIYEIGSKHKSTKQIVKVPFPDKIIDELYQIFTAEIKELIATRCVPVFRDSIVFYDKKDQIKGILHLCFECIKVINENGEKLDIDFDSFEKLKNYLNTLGHKIE